MSDDANLVERDARRRLLAEIGSDGLSSHEIATRLAGDAREPTAPEAEASLLPELHRLESDGKVRAGWEPSSTGKVRRRYRTR